MEIFEKKIDRECSRMSIEDIHWRGQIFISTRYLLAHPIEWVQSIYDDRWI